MKILNKQTVLAMMLAVGMGFSACVDDPDGENLYTSTGKTIANLIEADSNLTSFNYILERANLVRSMDAYGQFTCYAPENEGIATYIDSLWNDPEAIIPHNGMKENSVEGLSDSLCLDIARYHLANGIFKTILLDAGGTFNTFLGRSFSVSVDSLGRTVLNGVSIVTSRDNDATNGVLHKISQVMPRTTRLLAETLRRLPDYSIFSEALQRTGLCDSVKKSNKGITYTMQDHTDTDGTELYYPTECRIGYTIFAESNATLANYGIHSFDDLVAYVNKVYQNASSWYDLLNEKGIQVSTGNDYTERFNALNMFVAYHILYASMPQDQLVFERKSGVADVVTRYNYVNEGEPYDYYETMLPQTLMKLWKPRGSNAVFINRYQTFNTLTDGIGTLGNNHTLIDRGTQVIREDIVAYNGYIHPIARMLFYDKNVANGVLNERLRFDANEMFVELINNNIRYTYPDEFSAMNNGGSGVRVAIPIDYLDNFHSYNTTTNIRVGPKGAWWSYQADIFQGWNNYDFCVKLPPVPSGVYELRFPYATVPYGGMMQFYIGTSTDVQKMEALGVPFDIRIQSNDPRIGWTNFFEEEDLGIESDRAMRNRGYMRGSYGFTGHAGEGYDPLTTGNTRGSQQSIRRILGRIQMKQSENYYLRLKNVVADAIDLKWGIDFLELVPSSVIDNDQYAEDWY